MSTRKRARFENVESANDESLQPSSGVESNAAIQGESAEFSQSNRMDAFRRVAERRAEHFARAEKDNAASAASTTPTGRLRKVKLGNSKSNENNEKTGGEDAADSEVAEREQWPGPRSTARNILAQRDLAKREREEAAERMKNAGNFVDMNEKDAVLDIYDQGVSSLSSWKPFQSAQSSMKFIPKLSTLCIEVLSKHVVHYESLDFIAAEHLVRLADQLGKERRLDLSTCVRLAIAGSTSLYLPDCGAIDEDVLVQAVETVNGVHLVEIQDEIVVTEDVNIQPMLKLALKSCGRCFTDKVAASIYNHVHSLEELTLTGCYRLSDNALVRLLESCASSLQSLDMSCNSRLKALGISAIAKLPNLRSLVLDHVTHLTDEDLLLLIASPPSATSASSSSIVTIPRLTELSLLGCHDIGDASLVPFLESYGSQLQSFRVSSYKVADDTIVTMRNHCRQLRTLWLVNMAEVTASALIELFIVHQETTQGTSSIFLSKVTSDCLGPLQNVNLRGGVSVFDEAIVQLMRNYGRSLQELTIHGCSQLTNRAAAAIWLHGPPALKILDMSFVRKFIEAAVGKIMSNCPHLEVLRVWGCSQITSALLTGHNNVNLQIIGNFSKI
jgi:DNA repair protein RAD7